MRGCRLRAMRCSMAMTMLCCYLLTLMTMLANGQAYHFSQGWLPGRKRSPPAPAGNDVSEVSALPRLLQAEYNRHAATAVRKSVDGSKPRSRPFTIISNPGQHRTRLLKLVRRPSGHNKCAKSHYQLM